MRSRLASLALLLLALCRPASVGAAAAWGDAIYTADSAVTLDAAAKTAELKKILVEPTKYADLAPIMGNSLHALMLKGKGAKFDALPEYYKKALVNGVRCEVEETDIAKKIAKAQYGVDTLPIVATERTKEEALAKALTPAIDCTATTPNACFCTDKKPLLYCLADGIKGTKVTCRKEAVAELATKGKKALGPALEALTKITKPADTATPDDVLKAYTVPPTLAGVYCDVIDDTVTPSVEKLYAADALYWTMDSIAIAADFGKGEANLDKVCANDEAKNNPIVKCVCDKKVGLLTCMGATIGGGFKTMTYLDCGATPKFDETKKAGVLAQMGGGGPPTAAPPAGGNETTTAATGGAASSSLLLAPLAAAAAALLLL